MLHDCPHLLLPRHDCRHRRGRETRTHDAFSHRARGGHTLLGEIALDWDLGDAGLQLLTCFKFAARPCMSLSPQTLDSEGTHCVPSGSVFRNLSKEGW